MESKDFLFLDENLLINKYMTKFPSIPNISLSYSDSNIMIKSYCYNQHKKIFPINEFLIIYHPLYQLYSNLSNFKCCNKCMLQLFYSQNNKNLFLNYCQECNIVFCFHKEHHHQLEIIEKKIPILKDFIFPICPFCENGKQTIFSEKIDGFKLNQKYLKNINEFVFKNNKNLEDIEKEFNDINNGKTYLSLFPYYDYFMKMNYLEIILCENLLKTYNYFEKKKEMHFQSIQNIENIFNYLNYKFTLGKLTGEEKEIKSLINHFNNLNNCFLLQTKNKTNIIENSKNYNGGMILCNNYYNYQFKKYLELDKKPLFFPEIKKFFILSENILFVYDFYNVEIKKKIILNESPINILYIKKNLFFFEYLNKLELYSFYDDGNFVEFKIKNTILMNKNNKKYLKIIVTKNKKFICFEKNSIDFYLFDLLTTNVTYINSMNGIYFIKRINSYLILLSSQSFFIFLNENGEEIIKINLNNELCINEEQLCIYKEKYLVFISSNKNNIILINLNSLEIEKKLSFSKYLIEKTEIENKNIIDNNNNLIRISIGLFSKSNNFSKHYDNFPLVIENKKGIIIYYNMDFYFLQNIEKKNSFIEKLLIKMESKDLIKLSVSRYKYLFRKIIKYDENNYIISQDFDFSGVDLYLLSF